MFGKAIIATILGAGVTGGAVYLAANPQLLDTDSANNPQAVQAPETQEQAAVEAPLHQDHEGHSDDHDHDDDRDHDPDRDNALDMPDGKPIEVVLIDPVETSEEAPVLPEAKQLTTRTVIEPENDDDAAPVEQARVEAEPEAERADLPAKDEEAVQARRMANADFSRIITQAERMASVDLRDQAYLSAVEFALSYENFTGADEAMQSLSQPQLRDTARSKIAVKYAKSGKTDAAFRIIDRVEIDDLRDFMRLQVIEAVARKD